MHLVLPGGQGLRQGLLPEEAILPRQHLLLARLWGVPVLVLRLLLLGSAPESVRLRRAVRVEEVHGGAVHVLHAVGDGRAHVRGRVRGGGVAANGARAAVTLLGRRGPRPLPRAHRHGRREPDPPRLHRQGRRRQTRRGGVRRQAGLLVEQRLRGEDVLRQRLRHVRRRGALFGQGFIRRRHQAVGLRRREPGRVRLRAGSRHLAQRPRGHRRRQRGARVGAVGDAQVARRRGGNPSPRRDQRSGRNRVLHQQAASHALHARQRGCRQGGVRVRRRVRLAAVLFDRRHV